MRLRFILVLLGLLAFTSPALADDYAAPTLDNLARALVRFGAIDIQDNALLDDYAKITDCELVKYFYDNDFRWNQVRGMIRESIGVNVGSFPTGIKYDTKLQLDRYDFDQKLYRLTERSTVHNVNSFILFQTEKKTCAGYPVKHMPIYFRAVLDVPVTVPGLPLAEKDADALFKRFRDAGNDDHIVYTRFNLRIAYIEPLRKTQMLGEVAKYSQSSNSSGSDHAMRFDVRLESIDFFEDPEMTKLIYGYKM